MFSSPTSLRNSSTIWCIVWWCFLHSPSFEVHFSSFFLLLFFLVCDKASCTAPWYLSPFGPWNMDQQYGPRAQPSSYPKSQSKPIKATSRSSKLFKRPKERAVDASSHLALPRGLFSACRHRAKLQSFDHTIVCMPGNALGDIAAEHIYWSRNHFQSHSHLKPTYN